MHIIGVQIIAVLFAFFMIYVSFLHWKRKDLSGGEIFFWVILWAGFIIVAFFPNILQSVSQVLFFARVLDLLMISAFMILAFLGFRNYVSNKKTEKKIEELVQQEAIKSVKRKK